MKEITPQPDLEKYSTMHSDKRSNPSQQVQVKKKALRSRFWQGNGDIEQMDPMGCEEVPPDVGLKTQNLFQPTRKYI
jgi:hypothetical protein